MTTARIVLCTFPSDDVAARIARVLVESRLAACVNIVPGARSIYAWQGEVCDETEVVALMKTTADRFDALRRELVELHPYDCPEVIALAVDAGHAAYLDWVVAQVAPDVSG